MRDLLPVARIGIARIEDGTIVLAQIVHHAEEPAVGREADLVAGGEDLVELHLPVIVVDLGDGILAGGGLVELEKGHRLEVVLGVEDQLPAAQSDDRGGPAAGWMPDGAIGPAQAEYVVAGKGPFLDE